MDNSPSQIWQTQISLIRVPTMQTLQSNRPVRSTRNFRINVAPYIHHGKVLLFQWWNDQYFSIKIIILVILHTTACRWIENFFPLSAANGQYASLPFRSATVTYVYISFIFCESCLTNNAAISEMMSSIVEPLSESYKNR